MRKWTKTPEWDKALDVFGYEGDRNFEVQPLSDVIREQGQTYHEAREAYLKAMRTGEPKHKWATITGDAVGLTRRRVHEWALKYGWRDEIQKP